MKIGEFELFIFDLDGVIYLGNEPIPGAREVIDTLIKNGKKVFYLTNNSTRTRAQFCDKLKIMGIHATEEQIVTSAYASAMYLQQRRPKAAVYIIGEEGLITEFKNAGFQVYYNSTISNDIEYVIVGLDSNFNYEKLAIALSAIEKGAKFIATNDDPTLPTERGNLPGAGTMVSALSTAIYGSPMITIGKPNPIIIEFVLKMQNVAAASAVIIGDRYTTDIKAGLNAQIKTILVKTGTGLQEMKLIPETGPNPDYILESVADLIQYF